LTNNIIGLISGGKRCEEYLSINSGDGYRIVENDGVIPFLNLLDIEFRNFQFGPSKKYIGRVKI
jgi:hypothetical protein